MPRDKFCGIEKIPPRVSKASDMDNAFPSGGKIVPIIAVGLEIPRESLKKGVRDVP